MNLLKVYHKKFHDRASARLNRLVILYRAIDMKTNGEWVFLYANCKMKCDKAEKKEPHRSEKNCYFVSSHTNKEQEIYGAKKL